MAVQMVTNGHDSHALVQSYGVPAGAHEVRFIAALSRDAKTKEATKPDSRHSAGPLEAKW